MSTNNDQSLQELPNLTEILAKNYEERGGDSSLEDALQDPQSEVSRALVRVLAPPVAYLKNSGKLAILEKLTPRQVKIADEIRAVATGLKTVAETKHYEQCLTLSTRGDQQAVSDLRAANGAQAKFYCSTQGGISKGLARAVALYACYILMKNLPALTRETLWICLQRNVPVTLEGVESDKDAKSRAFKQAGLDWIPSQTGRPPKT